uniref:YMGG-like glycine zipper-containing protein n=1 Tax=uncultured Shimia sp. TaxID=573152 RepID=UPI0026219618
RDATSEKVGTMTHTRTNKVLATFVATLTALSLVAVPANAGNHVAKQAAKGAVVGAVAAEATGGDAAQGAATGAAVGAVVGAVQKDDFEDRHGYHNNGNGHGKNGGKHRR